MKTNRKIKSFFASFAITGILVGALCGFAAVDLSTDRYMPNRFGSFFEITGIKSESVEFNLFAEHYVLGVKPPEQLLALAKKYRGLMPVLPQMFSSLAADGASSLLKQLTQLPE